MRARHSQQLPLLARVNFLEPLGLRAPQGGCGRLPYLIEKCGHVGDFEVRQKARGRRNAEGTEKRALYRSDRLLDFFRFKERKNITGDRFMQIVQERQRHELIARRGAHLFYSRPLERDKRRADRMPAHVPVPESRHAEGPRDAEKIHHEIKIRPPHHLFEHPLGSIDGAKFNFHTCHAMRCA